MTMVTRSGVGRTCTMVRPSGIGDSKRLDKNGFNAGGTFPSHAHPAPKRPPSARQMRGTRTHLVLPWYLCGMSQPRVHGERDPAVFAGMQDVHCKASDKTIRKVLMLSCR